jgi:FERM central domain
MSRHGALQWLNSNVPLFNQIRRSEMVIFRKRYYISDQLVPEDDANTIHFMYLENKENIIAGALWCSLERAVELAALQMQAAFHNYDALVHVAGFLDLNEFIPQSYCNVEFLEEDIYKEHRMLRDVSETEAKYRYVKHCLNLPAYGMHLYRVTEHSSRAIDFNHDLLLGVCYNGVVGLDSDAKCVDWKHALYSLSAFEVKDATISWQHASVERTFQFKDAASAHDFAHYVQKYTGFVNEHSLIRKDSLAKQLAGLTLNATPATTQTISSSASSSSSSSVPADENIQEIP